MSNETSSSGNMPFVPQASDLLEAAEMLRASSTLLRQAFGIVNMAVNLGHKVSGNEFKSFAKHLDHVNSHFLKAYTFILKHREKLLKESENLPS